MSGAWRLETRKTGRLQSGRRVCEDGGVCSNRCWGLAFPPARIYTCHGENTSGPKHVRNALSPQLIGWIAMRQTIDVERPAGGLGPVPRGLSVFIPASSVASEHGQGENQGTKGLRL